MRVTSKGQVTIPKHIRDRLGIKPGSEVEFVATEGGTVELIRSESSGDDVLGSIDAWLRRIEGTGDSGLNADDIMTMTRDRPNGHDR